MAEREYAEIKGPYPQKSIRKRIEAFFLDNLGKIATREQIMEVAKDPETGRIPENWHQRLSELRTDEGYTIQSWRNRGELRVSEYVMPSAEKRPRAGRRVTIKPDTWRLVLQRTPIDVNGQRAPTPAASVTAISTQWEEAPCGSRLTTGPPTQPRLK